MNNRSARVALTWVVGLALLLVLGSWTWHFSVSDAMPTTGSAANSALQATPTPTPTPTPNLRFTMPQAGGEEGTTPGTLALYDGDTLIKSWSAGSGDNKPDHQNQKDVGPIPEGTGTFARSVVIAGTQTGIQLTR
jgi:hypothetical protein